MPGIPDFEQSKAQLLQQIEIGGFSHPRTQRAREYLDRLIAADLCVRHADSIRARMAERDRRHKL